MNTISTELFSSFNRTIQNIYQGASAIPSSEFNRWALNILAEVVPFDYALGGHIPGESPGEGERFYFHPASGALVGWNPTDTPCPRLFQDHRDLAADASAFLCSTSPDCESTCPDADETDHRLRSAHTQGDHGAGCFLILYRTDPAKPFSANDRWVVGSMLPHFIEAQRLAGRSPRSVRPGFEGQAPAACALFDESGRIVAADPGFANLCLDEWPESAGHLGAEIVGLLKDKEEAHGEVAGRTLSLCVRRLAEFYQVTLRPKNELEELPPRLLVIARLLGRGMSYKEVAKELSISPSTVTNQANHIYQRLGLKNKAELARLATQCFFHH